MTHPWQNQDFAQSQLLDIIAQVLGARPDETGETAYPEESINEAVIRIADALEHIASVMDRQSD